MLQKNYYRENLRLSIPIMLSSLGQSLVQMVDTLMVGQLGTTSLAAISFASALTVNALMIGMGIAMALTPLIGQNHARNNKSAMVDLFQNSLSLNTLIGVVLVSILLLLTPLLSHFGQPSDVIKACKPYYIVVTCSFIPMLIFLTFKQFLEGINNTKAAMVITIGANVLNVILNYIFIFGKLGLPAMGVFGAGLSTFISRLLSPIAFYIYIKKKDEYHAFIRSFKASRFSFHIQKRLLTMGVPIAGQMFIEMAALFGITVMMGWISKEALAAFQIVNTLISTTFLTASGIAAAITVLVSHAYGAENEKELKKCFFTGWKMVLCIMGTFAVCFIFLGRYIAMLFSNDPIVIDIAASVFVVAGLFQIFDGTQVTGLAGLRGINDVARPMLYALIVYPCVCLPFAYLCGFVLNLGPWSLLAGFCVGLITAGFLYHRRFYISLKKHFHPLVTEKHQG